MDDHRIIRRAGRDQLGEGPIWVAREGALFWVDILGRALWRLDIASGATQAWTMPEKIGWMVDRAGRDDYLIGLKSGIAELSLDPFAIRPLVSPEPGRPTNRLNDAKVDAAGRLWFGSKDDADRLASGALYRIGADHVPHRQDDGYLVANGPAFSPDGRHLYHTDSGRRLVYRFAVDDAGAAYDRDVFIEFPPEWGYPDGMTTDDDGCLWIAHWGGGRVSRFDPAGKLIRALRLPARNITSCAFAGERLDRLFVTSAAMDSAGGDDDGALFELDPGTRGFAPTPFAG